MKVCLYLETFGVKLPGGIMTAHQTQVKALEANAVDVVTNPKQSYEVLHVYLPFLRSYYLVLKCKLLNKPIVTHIHMTAEDFKNSFVGSNIIAPFLKMWLKYFYKKGDVILTPSEYTKQLAINSYNLPKEKIIVVSNGIDCDNFSPNAVQRNEYRKRYNMKNVTVFSLGWVIPRKGIYTFIDAAKSFPDTQFFWFGQMAPKHLTHLPRPIEQLPNMQFAGRIDDARGAMNGGDIFLFPSYEENQGIVVLEAAANAKAMILRDIPVFAEFIHGEHCFKAKTDLEFEKYLDLLINDKNLREKMGKSAQKKVLEHDYKKVGEKLKNIYEQVLANKKLR